MAAKVSALGNAFTIGLLGILSLAASTADAAPMWKMLADAKAVASGAPKISGTPPSAVVAGAPYDFRPAASDPNGDSLRFSINTRPRWATFDVLTGRLSGTPSAIDVGRTDGIRISVSDGRTTVSLKRFGIRVSAGTAPIISGTPATSVLEQQAYSFQPTASDADRQALTFAVVNKPAWASFETTTGRLAGTPPVGSARLYSGIGISVTDGASTANLPPFSITVSPAPVNRPPQISGTPASSVEAGQSYVFTPAASDADGDPLRYSVVNRPTWLGFDNATGRLSGTPQAGNVGTHADIVISVSDGKEVAFLPVFSITVTAAPVPAPNTPPTISGTPPANVTAGQAYAFQPSASDADGQLLRFGIANKPVWAAFDTVSGRLSGTPATSQVGTYSNIVISVSDGAVATPLPAFSITVAAPANRAPTISGTPSASVTEASAYSFQPTASDPDGDTLTFSVNGAPAWLTLNGSTGRLGGTPPKGSAGTYGGIVLTVSDGKATTALPAFSITVNAAPNTPPTISGSPPTTVVAGQAYAFQPTAADPDGQTLRFGIANKPSWAAFDIATGRLSGTPAAANVGTQANVVISVSDGAASATLPAFSITVTSPPATGTAELNWAAPTQNEDGSALTNLAGYKVRYGTSPTSLTRILDIGSPAITTAVIEGLASGTWYFTVASYTNVGVESAQTRAVSKTIP